MALGLSIDWPRITLQSGNTNHTLSFRSKTIYESQTKSWLGRETIYRFTRNDGWFGEVAYCVRNMTKRIFEATLPMLLLSDTNRSRDSTSMKVAYLSVIAVTDLLIVASMAIAGVVPVIVHIAAWVLVDCLCDQFKVRERLGGYFPLSTALPLLALGVAASMPAAAAVTVVSAVTEVALNSLGLRTEGCQQDASRLLETTSSPGAVIAMVVVLGPIIEEVIFRGVLRDLVVGLEPKEVNPEKYCGMTWERLVSVAKVSLIFGLVHLSPNQGWLNVPIVIALSVLGFIMGMLREYTGNLWAPTGLHMANNGLAVASQLLAAR